MLAPYDADRCSLKKTNLEVQQITNALPHALCYSDRAFVAYHSLAAAWQTTDDRGNAFRFFRFVLWMSRDGAPPGNWKTRTPYAAAVSVCRDGCGGLGKRHQQNPDRKLKIPVFFPSKGRNLKKTIDNFVSEA